MPCRLADMNIGRECSPFEPLLLARQANHEADLGCGQPPELALDAMHVVLSHAGYLAIVPGRKSATSPSPNRPLPPDRNTTPCDD